MENLVIRTRLPAIPLVEFLNLAKNLGFKTARGLSEGGLAQQRTDLSGN